MSERRGDKLHADEEIKQDMVSDQFTQPFPLSRVCGGFEDERGGLNSQLRSMDGDQECDRWWRSVGL